MSDRPKNVVIVGAGPAGLLLAHYLLQRHYTVALYERRPDPRGVPADQRRSFPISLQIRGQKAIRGIPGLEAALAKRSTFCQGTVIHGKKSSRDIKRAQKIMAIDRNQLVITLIEELTHRYNAPELTLAFNCACDRLDDSAQTITFQRQNGETFTVQYGQLVGADGANSQVRRLLAEDYAFKYAQTYVPDAYKSLFLGRTNAEAGVELAPDRIHSANLDDNVRVVLAPQSGDRLHGAFIFNANHNPLADYTQPDQVLDYFEAQLPAFSKLFTQEEADALLKRPVARLTTVKCDRFHYGDRIVLVGDAIHAVSPSVGQGCNAALQDVEVFNRLLEQHQDNWAEAIADFSQQRRADAYALRDLSDYSFPRTKSLVIEFFVRLLLSRKLHQWFPKQFKPFLFDQLFETDLDYAEVLKNHQQWINKVKQSVSEKAVKS